MASYKVIFRADENTTGRDALLWEPPCPVMLSAVQISRNTQTSKAYLQIKVLNISNEELKSVYGKSIIKYEDGASEEIYFEDLDVDVLPEHRDAALKPMALSRGDAVSATVAISQVITENGKWVSSGSASAFPQGLPLSLSEKAREERNRKLEEAGIRGGAHDFAVQDHSSWWVCSCGQANVGLETCCACGASKTVLQSVEDERELIASANARVDEIYQKAVSLSEGEVYAPNLKKAITLFNQIGEWKDSAERASSCEGKIEELKAASKKTRAKIAKRAAIAIAALLLTFLLIAIFFIAPQKYEHAKQLIDSGQYEEALSELDGLFIYKDSADMRKGIHEKEAAYSQALQLIDEGNYADAKSLFEEIKGYKDASTYYSNIIRVPTSFKVTSEDYGETREAAIAYDDEGRIGTVSELESTPAPGEIKTSSTLYTYTYDEQNRLMLLAENGKTIDRFQYSDEYSKYPEGYDSNGNLSNSETVSSQLDEHGNLIKRSYSFGMEEEYRNVYDDNGLLTNISYSFSFSSLEGKAQLEIKYGYRYITGADFETIMMNLRLTRLFI